MQYDLIEHAAYLKTKIKHLEHQIRYYKEADKVELIITAQNDNETRGFQVTMFPYADLKAAFINQLESDRKYNLEQLISIGVVV